MDNIEKLIKELKEENFIWSIRGKPIEFSAKFLETTGEIFEKHGFGVTRVYLLNQSGRDRVQANSLLKVIEIMEKYPEVVNNRAIGRYIIKSLIEIKKGGLNDK